ncbi:MAG: hypothetical protein JXR65_11685 [Bacteroidales bacterium]|nr:hypothetical protein [Bacteroidales bacterium]
MKQTIRITVLLGLFIIIGLKGFSQVSVSYYSSPTSKIGVGYNFNDKVWGELRIYSNTYIEDITPEAVLCYNFINKERHNVYVGIGGVVNYFNGIIVPVGVQFTPIKTFKRFSLHLELETIIDIQRDANFILQSSWGIRYKLGKKN